MIRVKKEYKLFSKLIPNMNGIYYIYNVISGRLYIGSSVNIKHRIGHHLIKMKDGKHPSELIIQDFKEYGISSFRIGIIEGNILARITREQMKEREKSYIRRSCAAYNAFYNPNWRPKPFKPRAQVALRKDENQMQNRRETMIISNLTPNQKAPFGDNQ